MPAVDILVYGNASVVEFGEVEREIGRRVERSVRDWKRDVKVFLYKYVNKLQTTKG